jgi:hypothetical protein
MLKEATYKEKYTLLKEWMPQLVDTIKRDLKVDHLSKNAAFSKKYLSNKNLNKLTSQELAEAYYAALQEGDESLGEAIAQRWVIKNSEIYQYFEVRLSQINKNFTELEEIPQPHASSIAEEASQQFGPMRTYIFSILNSVVFPKNILDKLNENARKVEKQRDEERNVAHEKKSQEDLIRDHQLEISRLTDKYEKKLSGLQKKYIQDTQSYKKQIAALQKKLNPQTAKD